MANNKEGYVNTHLSQRFKDYIWQGLLPISFLSNIFPTIHPYMTILEVLIPENFGSPAKWEHSAFYG